MNRRDFIISSSLAAVFFNPNIQKLFSAGRNYFDDYDEVLCRKKFSLLIDAEVAKLPIGDAIAEIGKTFLGTDYVGGTLDKDSKNERLVINLQGLDCVTFVENCLVFARCLKKGNTSFSDYKDELQKIRYRDGIVEGYGSRLHYFCDWIYNNEDKKILKNVTQEIGGVAYNKTINFMTNHASSYKQLSDKSNLETIKISEEAINSRDHYYIPKKNISDVYSSLKSGDIIATTTTIEGLDVTHTGYVYKESGSTYFLHASLKSKQVIISKNELGDYVSEDSKKTGIMVARPQEM